MAELPLDRFTEVHLALKACCDGYAPLVSGDPPLVKSVNVVETTDDPTLAGLLDTLQESHTPRIEIVQGAWNTVRPVKSGDREVPIHATYVMWLTTAQVRIKQLNRVKFGILGALSVSPNPCGKRSIHFARDGLWRLPYLTDWTINAADRTSGDIALGPQKVIVRDKMCAASVLSVTVGWVWSFGEFLEAQRLASQV